MTVLGCLAQAWNLGRAERLSLLSSMARAAERMTASSNGRPWSCTESGMPFESNPVGTLKLGKPVRLLSRVKRP